LKYFPLAFKWTKGVFTPHPIKLDTAMDANRAFALKISIMNSLGFAATIFSTTFVDARLSSSFYGPRIYPLGYWPSLLAIPIFAGTYFWLTKPRPLTSTVSVPALVLLIAGIVCLPAYLPEFPHGNIATWITFYSLVTAASCWIHYSHSVPGYLNDQKIPAYLRFERIKQSADLWRTFSIYITVGYIALLIPWANFIWDFARRLVTVPREVNLVGSFPAMELTVFSLYFLFAIVYEGFRRSTITADLMLEIRNESTAAPCETSKPASQPNL
jgi:hypothetical protein